MKILFYFGHPAQYLFLRETIRRLSASNQYTLTILIKTKDVLEQLLINDGIPFTNILPRVRGKSKVAIAFSLFKRDLAMLPIVLKTKPDLMIGTDATIAQLGRLLNINRITITEDDYEVIKGLSDLSYPFAQTILCPQVCGVGKWESKKIGYAGYMKLGYLHPNVFREDNTVSMKYNLPEKFILIRLSQLRAHHDFGIKGIDKILLNSILSAVDRENYAVFISSEGTNDADYAKYALHINPSDMHQVLAKAVLLISDSQSMTMEAAMLGIPSLRYSDFVGRISVLEELEQLYRLTYGIRIGNESLLIDKLNELLNDNQLRETFQQRRKAMLADKIDVTAFLVWFIENYPSSKIQMRADANVQNQFKHS